MILKKGTFFNHFLALFLICGSFICFKPYVANAKNFNHNQNCLTKDLSYYSSPRVKNKCQSINGPCWSFANIASLETTLNNNSLLENSLSEKHLLSWVNQSLNKPGYHIPLKNGGAIQTALAYFSSGIGPVFESDCPYNTIDTCFNSNLENISPEYWVKGAKNVNTDINSIKQDISKYGAVTIVYNVNDQLNHAVSAIGWDDKNKSWIVKDSAKTHNNYVNLPYSTKILTATCFTDVEKFPANQKIHQLDPFGATANYGNDELLTVANVYDFDDNEKLHAVTINSSSENAKINLYLAPILNNAPNKNKLSWTHLYSGSVPYDGYFTFTMKNNINLNKGKYAIIAQIEKTSASKKPEIGCQLPNDYLTSSPCSPGECFLQVGNEFWDITNIDQLKSIAGFSIKAITRY